MYYDGYHINDNDNNNDNDLLLSMFTQVHMGIKYKIYNYKTLDYSNIMG